MMKNEIDNIEIDKLTRSIENVISGDVFDTELILLNSNNTNELKKYEWLFDWYAQLELNDREIYKLVINGNSEVIQGLVSLTDRGYHIYMNLIESSKFNRGKNKIYYGVPGNLVAHAYKISFEKGYGGFVAFDAKTKLIKHYEETIFATHFKGTRMFIGNTSALRLVTQYFGQEGPWDL